MSSKFLRDCLITKIHQKMLSDEDIFLFLLILDRPPLTNYGKNAEKDLSMLVSLSKT